jgi:hypothetical protein
MSTLGNGTAPDRGKDRPVGRLAWSALAAALAALVIGAQVEWNLVRAIVAGIIVAGIGALTSFVVTYANPTPPPKPGALPQLPEFRPRPGGSPPTPPRSLVRNWIDARDRFAALQRRYAAYECDALAVLRMPGLADMSVAETARFVDAFALAQALLTEAQPAADLTIRFERAVTAAERAWVAAQDRARQLAHSALDPAERRAVERVIELLVSARDIGSEPERRAAYSIAVSELAALERTTGIIVPRPAVAALTAAARGRLTG